MMVMVTWLISVPSPIALEELLTPQSLTSYQVCILAQPFLLLLCLRCSCCIVSNPAVLWSPLQWDSSRGLILSALLHPYCLVV